MHQLIQHLTDWYNSALQTGGYGAVVLLMTMESSFLPLPSEVIIPPAAHLADIGQLKLSFAGIILAGAFGSWLGATIMYWFARVAGRPLVLRYGRLVLFPPEKLEKAERWMSHYGAMGVFIARLLPGARQLVGIPAGIARLSYLKFSIFTIIGSTIWCSVLCYVGVKAGQDQQLMHGELRHVALWLGCAVLVMGGLYYFFVHRHMQKKA
jgi:membrane protein DedA with SNARE-associated domain